MSLDSSVSALFNSLNSGNSNSGSIGSIDLANYAAIKNGSYGKLVKSYYAETSGKTGDVKSSSATSKSQTSKATSTKKDVDTTGLTQMKKDADKLKASAEALNKEDLWKTTDGKADTKAIVSAVKDFANDYNKVIDQASKVNSKEIANDTKFMTGMTDTFTKVLGKIGITVGTDGKMSVDEEALGKADIATAKSLFAGNATYGSQIADKAGAISKDTELSTGIYNGDATVSSTLSSLYNQLI